MAIEITIHTLHDGHPQIRAEDFRSPLVRRLAGTDHYKDGQVEIENEFKNGKASKSIRSKLKLTWSGLKSDHDKCIKTYQAPVLTEFATLGLACILVKNDLNLEITEVTRRGDRADYWIGDRSLMLEVSGAQTGDLENLFSEKAHQLLQNPFKKDGYVCVTIYDLRKSRLVFCKFVENQNK